jgi:hypothetical protein
LHGFAAALYAAGATLKPAHATTTHAAAHSTASLTAAAVATASFTAASESASAISTASFAAAAVLMHTPALVETRHAGGPWLFNRELYANTTATVGRGDFAGSAKLACITSEHITFAVLSATELCVTAVSHSTAQVSGVLVPISKGVTMTLGFDAIFSLGPERTHQVRVLPPEAAVVPAPVAAAGASSRRRWPRAAPTATDEVIDLEVVGLTRGGAKRRRQGRERPAAAAWGAAGAAGATAVLVVAARPALDGRDG